MTVLARDTVAADHLVYAWPFPIGPDCEIACAQDEEVVMCPAWMVGDRFGPGRHYWRSQNPMHPTAAFFVRTAPVDVVFDLTTGFLVPTTGLGVRLRAAGTLSVRCADAGLLIAQFVGLPFDNVNDGVLRSVSRSIERMLARLLIRRVVMAGTPLAATDVNMLPGIVEELIAYNPTAGAVFGIDLIQVSSLVIGADDGSTPYVQLPYQVDPWGGGSHPDAQIANGQLQVPVRSSAPDLSLTETARGRPAPLQEISGEIRSGEINPKRHPSVPPGQATSSDGASSAATSGEILVRPKTPVPGPLSTPPLGTQPPSGAVADVPRRRDEITQPGVRPATNPRRGSEPSPIQAEHRGAIMGIGMASIGSTAVAGEIPMKVPPGRRVLVPGPNGLMQSATVRQLLDNYYELEVGSSGETIWVPINGVVPE